MGSSASSSSSGEPRSRASQSRDSSLVSSSLKALGSDSAFLMRASPSSRGAADPERDFDFDFARFGFGS
eukprot:CAMPEP_0204180012 /NCGR_PEP_ID=MMETSP0361-20130328/50649_1 /ASSEMBLY_ACC=CAM_ASM_000343 /TAXON_ID=268821 /ORGANISM="Scrippsiella Hangoei, Strain SHTV-5" /LENGTH=68 /DNA_ID=CAMNT_0051139367 /DNA_START=42 /DNA_END=244 /DNA_ORIENTATION=-